MAAQLQQQSIFIATIARFMVHALNTFYCRGALGTGANHWIRIPSDACWQANSISIRYVWTGKFLKFGKKKLRIRVEAPYPDIFQSATFYLRIRLPSTRIRRIRQRIRILLNPLSRVEKNKSATNPITCGQVTLDIFESDDVANSCPVSYRTKSQYGAQQQQQGK